MPPMSGWFSSVPHGLDALANAAKFQLSAMASLIRFYKRKCSQQRTAMKKNGDTAAENKTLRMCVTSFLSPVPLHETSRLIQPHFPAKYSSSNERTSNSALVLARPKTNNSTRDFYIITRATESTNPPPTSRAIPVTLMASGLSSTHTNISGKYPFSSHAVP